MLIVTNDRRKWFKDLLLTCRNIYLIPSFPRERPRTSPTPTRTAWTVRPLSGSTCLSGASRRLTTWGCSSGNPRLILIYVVIYYDNCNISSVQITFRQQWNDNRSIISSLFPLSALSPPSLTGWKAFILIARIETAVLRDSTWLLMTNQTLKSKPSHIF